KRSMGAELWSPREPARRSRRRYAALCCAAPVTLAAAAQSGSCGACWQPMGRQRRWRLRPRSWRWQISLLAQRQSAKRWSTPSTRELLALQRGGSAQCAAGLRLSVFGAGAGCAGRRGALGVRGGASKAARAGPTDAGPWLDPGSRPCSRCGGARGCVGEEGREGTAALFVPSRVRSSAQAAATGAGQGSAAVAAAGGLPRGRAEFVSCIGSGCHAIAARSHEAVQATCCTRRRLRCGRGADSEGSTPPSRLSSKVAFEAVEDLPTDGSSPEGLLPYALLPTVLPGSPQHLGLLLAGAGGMLEEWDLDVGLRLDRLSVVEETRADVVSLAAPSSATHEVLVAAVNCPDDAGLALLRREADVWQLESPWPCTTTGWRHLARVSHGNFLQCSQSVMALGQTSAIGTHEVGVYDVALEPRPLTACLGHWDFVTDVCTISTQTFGSVSLDGMLLLWDFRQGLTPSAKAGFGATAPKALCSLAACRDLLLCGGLQGELCLFDLRRLAEPLARPPAASGAVVRLRLWPSTAQTLVAAVVGADCGTGILQPALFQPALKEPRLCYDVAAGPAAWHSEPGPGSAVFACSDGNLV
ncbi:unnamed protein product, partial [Effrenium voratum]